MQDLTSNLGRLVSAGMGVGVVDGIFHSYSGMHSSQHDSEGTLS